MTRPPHRPHGPRPLLAALALVAASCGADRASGPLPHEVYVWQRAWTPAVRAAVASHGRAFDAVTVLDAELSWSDGRPAIARAEVDWPTLAASARRVGLALRVGPVPATELEAAGDAVVDLATAAVARARSAGVALRELQIDFDAASAQLDAYAAWLVRLRAALPDLPLAITALPDWLGRPGFDAIVNIIDSFVLQVHSVARPTTPDALPPLCDPTHAQRWISAAADYGRPFRVALPTYGYRVGFSPAGAFIGLAAEAPARPWPDGTVVRELRADPVALGALVRALERDRPAALTGLAWYRLPVAGDSLVWSDATFAAVRRGEAVTARVEAEVVWPEPRLAEIRAVNRGTADAPTPRRVELRWQGAAALAGDALAGYGYDDAPAATGPRARFDRDAAAGTLAPGAARPLGWVRFDLVPDPETVVVHLDP